jgi:hypothetical protein
LPVKRSAGDGGNEVRFGFAFGSSIFVVETHHDQEIAHILSTESLATADG